MTKKLCFAIENVVFVLLLSGTAYFFFLYSYIYFLFNFLLLWIMQNAKSDKKELYRIITLPFGYLTRLPNPTQNVS